MRLCICLSQPVKFLHDTIVAHGMSVSQLKQAILNELAEKQVMNGVPLNWSVVTFSVLSALVQWLVRLLCSTKLIDTRPRYYLDG